MEAEYARALAELRALYSRLVADAQRAKAAIDDLERRAGAGAVATEPVSACPMPGRRGRHAAFMPAVVDLLVNAEDQTLSTQDIVDLLMAIGFPMEAKDPYRNAAALLRREAARPDGQITKTGANRWTLVQGPAEQA